jgi:alpha-L-rhamnosidase
MLQADLANGHAHPVGGFLAQFPRRPTMISLSWKKRFLTISALTGCYCSVAQTNGELAEVPPRAKWTAHWIAHPTSPLREPRVFHFRKTIIIPEEPAHFIVHVSADNRFLLFLNGKRVGEGPARGDLTHWRYETFDLGPQLHQGANVLSATVWQFGIYAPLAQITDRAAFLVQGESEAEAIVNTDKSWQVEVEEGHEVIPRVANGFWFYWAASLGERVDAARYDWNWNDTAVSATSHFVPAAGAIRESIYPDGSVAHSRSEVANVPWLLIPDQLPAMEYQVVPVGKVIRTDLPAAGGFPDAAVSIPAHTRSTLLIDRKTLVTAYPSLVVSGGRGSSVRLTYTEALYDAKQERGNRNEIVGRHALGLFDEFLPDGGASRKFAPLWWRTWRYIEMVIETKEEGLTLEGMSAHFSAYPFKENAHFASSDPDLTKIWEICWRAARLDAHETYMDTPFWEQLQYVGDTRIQALISYVVSGDDRLARQALRAFDDSRIPEGLTQSRYPSSLPQLIPPFSLQWINMLHDYWMYRPDLGFVAELLPNTRPVIEWFVRRQDQDGLLKAIPYWTFVDTPGAVKQFPPVDANGKSAILTLQFIGALQDAAEMEEALGDKQQAKQYRKNANLAAESVYRECWNAANGLIADTPAKDSYSQHANALAVLYDVIPKAKQPEVMKRIMKTERGAASSEGGPPLSKVTYFFQFYLARAVDHAGMGTSYLELLKPWRGMLALGLSTTPEYPDPTRSDSHAWSAHPIYDIPTIVAGIHPAEPGFKRVRIVPFLGSLNTLEVSIPHQTGKIETSYKRNGDFVDATIRLPEGLRGVFVWENGERELHAGVQTFHLKETSGQDTPAQP